ncbi:hypothetical protein Baya_13976 [Bagarius yarrelli]|uniref:Uncharacterized protein n=1 Tax=Bagarius yarrelli TaxID=175774 RepID=A0A556V7F5_BAGYA|nr:hypothetical protein Baya_13976 [Bagarius yarrelli]
MTAGICTDLKSDRRPGSPIKRNCLVVSPGRQDYITHCTNRPPNRLVNRNPRRDSFTGLALASMENHTFPLSTETSHGIDLTIETNIQINQSQQHIAKNPAFICTL